MQEPYCNLNVFLDSSSFPDEHKADDAAFYNLQGRPPSYKTHHVPTPKCKHNGISYRGTANIICTTNAYSDNITNRVLSSYFNNFTTSVTQHDLSPVMLQTDSRANRSVTDNIHLLRDLKRIKSHYIEGIGSGIACTALGNYYMTANDGITIKVLMFFSSQSSKTVISPQDIYGSNKYYSIFTKECDTNTGKGSLNFCLAPALTKILFPSKVIIDSSF